MPCENAYISTTINATDTKNAQYNNAIHLHIPVFFGKNPMKTIILYASLEIAEYPRNQPYHLYVYIPICLQFDKILCKFFPK